MNHASVLSDPEIIPNPFPVYAELAKTAPVFWCEGLKAWALMKHGDCYAALNDRRLIAERMDAGAIAAQEWCFVKPGETARELWERALAPLGQKLLAEVIDYAKAHNKLPAKPQDESFATKAPALSPH